MKIKKTLATILTLMFVLCAFSSCGTKPENTILGKWYNEKGDCLEILSDNTYSIDKIYTGYEIGIDSGEWEYLEEGFFKFYANNYDESIIKVEINKDEIGTYIKYTYYGTFYKNQYPTEHIEEIRDSGDKSTSTESKNSQVSSNNEETNENDTAQTQTQANQSKPANTTNEPTHTHSYSNATCTSPKKCSCGETSGTMLGHSYSDADCTTPKKCTRCGVTAGTALGHQFSSATCTSPQICSRCGATSGNAIGHSYSDANCDSPKTCTVCGQTEGSALGHNYENNKCSRCGKVDPESLPVGLHQIPLIDSSYYNSYFHYSYNKDFTDSFGNKYEGVHFYNGLWERKFSIHNIDNKYSLFKGSIVATQNTLSGSKYNIEIYIDDILKFSKNGFTKTTGAEPFSINVKNGSQLKIVVYDAGGNSDVTGMEIGIVNAQLLK